MMRDRDGIYGDYFRRRVESFAIEEVLSAPRSPWQNPYVGRHGAGLAASKPTHRQPPQIVAEHLRCPTFKSSPRPLP
jgi:hypothetical protein